MDLSFIVVSFILLVFLLIQVSKRIKDVRYRKVFQGALLLWQLGVVLKIMHLPGANAILCIAPIAAFLVKAMSLSRQQTGMLDTLTLLWLGLFASTFIVRILHLPVFGELTLTILTIVQMVVFVVLVGWMIYENVSAKNA